MAAPARSRRPRWLTLTLIWGPPLLMLLGGIALVLAGHGHVSNIQDRASGSVFSSIPTDIRSLYSALGVSLWVVALMWVLMWYFMRLNSTDGADRAADEAARDYYARTGRWPGESGSRESHS